MGTQDGGIFRSTNNGARWTAVTSVGAYVSTLFADGENLLAGTLGGGVLVSPDEGEVWTARNSGVNNSIVVALAARGTDLFAGTSGAGAFRSTDAGKHWTSINAGLTNSNVLHLAVSGTNLVAGTPGGVFVSDDNGANWKSANVGLTNPYIDVLAVSDSNLIVVTSDNKVSFYANGGGSWTSPACVGLHGHIFCVAMSGTDMFVGTAGEGLLYRSTDQGASWTAANTGLACGNVYAIFKNRADLLAGTDKGVFLSTNCGSTWTSSGIVLSENSYLQTFAAHESALFAGSYYDGVFLSTNDGASWSAVGSGLPTTNIMSLAVCGRDLFAGTHGSGAWRRPLSEFSIPFQTEPVAYYPFDGNANDESEKGHDGIISGALLAAGRFGKPNSCYYFINQNYISVPHDSVFNLLGDMTISAWYKTDSSSANPMTLIAKRSGNSPFWEMAIQYPSKQMGFIFSDNSSNTVYHLSRGVVSSKTWQHVVVVVKHDSSFIWLDGAQDSGESLAIARSTNESPVTIGNAMAGSRECFVGWIDDIRIFNGALADSEIFYLFHEGGWGLPPGAPQLVSPLNGDGLSSSVISFLWNKAVSPAHPVTGYLFDLGIDSSFTSHTIDSTLTDTLKVVKDLLNGQKYWWRVKARSTVGWGSFGEKRKFKVAIAGVENAKELPKQFALGQNYPNPFNPGTKIEYALPRSSHVSLKVFNNLGQEVATLVNERQAAGFYNVRFNGTNIGSGVYFYRIQAGDFVATKKLLLIK